jgi:hypothetical protein
MFSAIFGIIADPYNVFHYKNIRDNGVEPNKNYIKMRYLLDNPQKFDAFLFGSSRVGGIDVDKIDINLWYNMTYSEGVPNEHLQNLQVLIQKNIIPSIVMIGIDDIMCYANPNIHRNQLLRSPYPVNAASNKRAYTPFLTKYILPAVLLSLPIIINHKQNNLQYREQFYENGGRSRAADERSTGKFAWQNVQNIICPTLTQTDNALADIQDIASLCGENNIELILFTNPMHVLTYTAAVKRGYINVLEKLSAAHEFYNFSSINDVAINNDNYIETSHYKLNVGYLIIDRIFNNTVDERLLSQGFGVYVTAENRNAFLDLLRSQAF